jgi:hypothetical protein
LVTPSCCVINIIFFFQKMSNNNNWMVEQGQGDRQDWQVWVVATAPHGVVVVMNEVSYS